MMKLNDCDDEKNECMNVLHFACRWPVWGFDPFGGQICYFVTLLG